jgi:SagB-type dehydrogenase family enzyme
VKPYAGRRRISLPGTGAQGGPSLADVVRGFRPAGAVAGDPLSIETLSRLLHLANGITAPGRLPLRAAPSAGALYAGEVYVLASRVEPLEPGVYSYHVPTHRLIQLASDPPLDVLTHSVEHPAALKSAPVLFLLTNVFHRYTHRYANRGYRYALIDSGHIGENLRLAAAAEGLGSVSPLRFRDDSLNALLEIDGRDEAVCALHAIGAPAQAGELPASIRFEEAGRSSNFAPPAGLSEPEVYHLATKLSPGSAVWSAEADARRTASSGTLELPRRVPSAASLAWAIEERRSAARFRDVPISLSDLSFILELAQGNSAATLAPWIDLRLVVHRVADLAPGVYGYAPDAHALAAVRGGEMRGAMRRACLGQEKAESAAVGFAMLADLQAAAAHGDRAYRDLLLESGAIAQRLYLAAEAKGLAARNLAAFFDDSLNGLLGVDGKRAAVVHLTMVGPGN